MILHTDATHLTACTHLSMTELEVMDLITKLSETMANKKRHGHHLNSVIVPIRESCGDIIRSTTMTFYIGD
jgi:ribosomal protein L32